MAGITLLTGELYQPVTQSIDVAEKRVTTARVDVMTPPRITPVYGGDRTQLGASQIKVKQGDAEIAHFRVIDSAYLAPGTYDLVLRDATGQDMAQTVTLKTGDDIAVTFTPTKVVTAVIHFLPGGRQPRIAANSTLWRDGEQVANVHQNNGVRIPPGSYDVQLRTDWVDYTGPITIAAAPDQQIIALDVPVGWVTVQYQDSAGNPVADKRIFVGRGADTRGRVRGSGEPIAPSPGTYNAEGWKGLYDKQVFDIAAGDEKTIIMRDKTPAEGAEQ